MNLEETKKIAFVIKSSYPKYYQSFSDMDMRNMIEVWNALFDSYSYPAVCAGVKAYMSNDTQGFPPVPGQIIDYIHKLAEKPENRLTESEAWSLVYKAICDSNYHSSERFDELPPLVQNAVGSPHVLQGWAQTDTAELEVIKSNFQRAYRTTQERHTEESKIPESVKALLENITEHLPQIEG